jgi:hypothetical protein
LPLLFILRRVNACFIVLKAEACGDQNDAFKNLSEERSLCSCVKFEVLCCLNVQRLNVFNMHSLQTVALCCSMVQRFLMPCNTVGCAASNVAPVYLLQAGGGQRSRVELLAELRDLKRRTTSYRAKKQRTPLQVT